MKVSNLNLPPWLIFIGVAALAGLLYIGLASPTAPARAGSAEPAAVAASTTRPTTHAPAPTAHDTAVPPTFPPAAVDTATPAPSPTPTGPQEYTVQAGDTLLAIAYTYNVSIAALQVANDIADPTELQISQVLLVPTPRPNESLYWSAYSIAPGDTLSDLLTRFDLSADELLGVNAMSMDEELTPGRLLIIPSDALFSAAAPPPPTEAIVVAAVVPPTVAPPPAANAAANAAAAPTTDPAAANAAANAAAAPTTASAAPTPEPTLEPTVAPPPAPPPSAGIGGNPDWAASVLAQINQARAANGVSALAYDTTLTWAAQAHANDCAQRGWCGHVGSDGAVLLTRLTRIGYPARAWGENWAWDRGPDSAFTRWFDEPPGADPHRRNILSGRYTEIGIGIAEAYSGGWFFIADFGAR